ncbi:hypothetical protein Golomagni_06100, partial [Golovinomyces magnicellulatus]
MALLNPVNAAIVPFLFLVTVPLALFAGITTTLAFSVLICRVIVVYLDIALSLVNQSLAGVKIPLRLQQAAIRSNSPSPTRGQPSLSFRRRRRRPSSVSVGTITPVHGHDASLGLTPSVGAERDYEGVGGWRIGDDDDIWTTINSRLELPDRHATRNHHRTPSGGPTTPGEGGYLMMKRRNRSPELSSPKMQTSPNSSRARTPSAT